MPRVLALLTDFGTADPYLAQMKGVLLGRAPDVVLLDICHEVRPHDVAQGAFFLAATMPYLPADSLVLTVVDPGVGSARKLLLLKHRHNEKTVHIIAPDNGLASLLPGEIEAAHVLDTSRLSARAQSESAVFHGRDLFAPFAAAFLNGIPAGELGNPMDPADMVSLQAAAPRLIHSTAVKTTVLHVDRFGNCITSLAVKPWADQLHEADSLRLGVPKKTALRFCRAYAELRPGEIGILPGSQGFLELALNQGRACDALQTASGMTLRLHWEAS